MFQNTHNTATTTPTNNDNNDNNNNNAHTLELLANKSKAERVKPAEMEKKKQELPTLHSLVALAKLNGPVPPASDHTEKSSGVDDNIHSGDGFTNIRMEHISFPTPSDGFTNIRMEHTSVPTPSESSSSVQNRNSSDVLNRNTDINKNSHCDHVLNKCNNNCDIPSETGCDGDSPTGNADCDKLVKSDKSGASILKENHTDLSKSNDTSISQDNYQGASGVANFNFSYVNKAYTESEEPTEVNSNSSTSLDNTVVDENDHATGNCNQAVDNQHLVSFNLSRRESPSVHNDSDAARGHSAVQTTPHRHNSKGPRKVRAPYILSRAFSMPSFGRTSKQMRLQKRQNVSQSNGTILKPLSEVRHEIQSGDNSHDKPRSRRKKLTLKLPSLRKRDQELPTANGTAPVSNATMNNTSSQNGSVPKTLKKRATFPFTKKAEKHNENPRTLTGTTNTSPRPGDPSGNGNVDPEEKEKERKASLAEDDDACGPCNCTVPLPRKVRDYMKRNNTIEGKEIRNTVVVSVAFQLIFTAHFAIQNLQSSLHEEEYLGVSALGCLYATSIFSSIFSPTIIGLLGTKKSLVLAWLCHILYTLAQFYPSWETLVPASILVGSMTGPAWTAQGLYVSACAYSFSKRSPHSPYTILSRFNGLFFTLYETRQILGNLLSSVVLKDGVANNSSEVIFKYCGPKDCPAAENVTDIEEPDAWVIELMLGIYMALQVLGLMLTVFLVTPLARSEWSARAPVRETVTSWFKTLVGTEMLFLVPFMVFQAMEQGILLSEYTKSYVSCPIGIHMVGFVMATHGATSAAFVFIFSRLAHLTGRFALFVIAAVISLVLLIVLFDWTPNSGQQALIFSFPVIWGIAEGIWQTQTNAMIAVVFWDRKEPAFANYQTWRALGYTFVFSFHSLLCVSTKIAIAIGLLVVGMVLYTGVEFHLRRKDRIQLPKGNADPEATGQKPGGEVNQSSKSAPLPSSSSTQGGKEVGGGYAPPPYPSSPVELRGFSHGVDEDSVMSVDRGGGGGGARSPAVVTVASISAFRFDVAEADHGMHLTLDGTCLTLAESAFLDNDVRIRYGVIPAGGNRPVTGTYPPSGRLTAPAHPSNFAVCEEERWEEKDEDEDWNSLANQRQARPHTWHEPQFEDEGELRVIRTKNDVLVY